MGKESAWQCCIAKSGDINLDGLIDSADSSLIQRWLAGLDITPPNITKLSKSDADYLANLAWLADSGSLAAESRLAEIQKEDVPVNVWLSDSLIGATGHNKDYLGIRGQCFQCSRFLKHHIEF